MKGIVMVVSIAALIQMANINVSIHSFLLQEYEPYNQISRVVYS
jgi:hypothetical protein